ncbi:MAG: hypothetical protein ABIK43_02785, partial [candidate division WOR-3 bacterium]
NPQTDFDFWTVKASLSGETLWTARHGSDFNCEDRIWASALDNAGNLVVCGGTIASLHMDWDFQVVKYNPDGKQLWSWRCDLSNHGDDRLTASAVACDNSIYLTGSAPNRQNASRRDADVVIVRLSSAGDTIWTRIIDGGAYLDDGGIAIAVDKFGNCYVAAKVTNSYRSTDIALLKYSPTGRLIWRRSIDGPGHKSDFPTGLLLNFRDEPIVIGAATGSTTGFDYYIGLFDTLGRARWQQTFDAAGRVDIPSAVCLDSSGNIVVTGQSTAAASFDILTLSYTPSGRLCWSHRYNGECNGADRGSAVAAAADRIYVGGSSDGLTGYPDLVVLALSTTDSDADSISNRLLWESRYCGGGTGESKVIALSVLSDGLLAAGYACRPGTSFDYLLLRFKGK